MAAIYILMDVAFFCTYGSHGGEWSNEVVPSGIYTQSIHFKLLIFFFFDIKSPMIYLKKNSDILAITFARNMLIWLGSHWNPLWCEDCISLYLGWPVFSWLSYSFQLDFIYVLWVFNVLQVWLLQLSFFLRWSQRRSITVSHIFLHV